MTGLKVNLDVTLSSELSVFDSDLVGRSHAIVYCPE